MSEIKGKNSKLQFKSIPYWKDSIIQNYYWNFFENLTSKELDEEFRNDIRVLSKSLRGLSELERKVFIELFSRIIKFYIENKIEKEIQYSLKKLLKL